MAVIARITTRANSVAGRMDGNVVSFQCDTLAERPTVDVIDGYEAYIQQTGLSYVYLGGVWVTLSQQEVPIANLSEFPAPVAGVITLADDTNYRICGEVSLGANSLRFGARSGLTGSNRVNDRLVYTGTGTMCLIGAGAVVGFFQEIGLRAPSGTLMDVSGASVTFIDVAFGSIANGGNMALSGAFSFGLRTSSMVNAFTTTGFTFTGSSTSAMRVFDNLARGNVGTMFALGTAAFAVIDIGRNVVDTSAGQTFLSGTTGGANVTASGLMVSNALTGAGTAVSTIAGTDPRWLWSANAGVTNTPVQTIPVGGVFVADVPTTPATLLAYGTWAALPSIGGMKFWKRTA